MILILYVVIATILWPGIASNWLFWTAVAVSTMLCEGERELRRRSSVGARANG
jgi:hypothetical protein